MSLCVSRVVLSLNVLPHSSHMKSFIPIDPGMQYMMQYIDHFHIANSNDNSPVCRLQCLSMLTFWANLRLHSLHSYSLMPLCNFMWCRRACLVFIPAQGHSVGSIMPKQSKSHRCSSTQWELTFPTLGTKEVSNVVVDPQVLLQHVLPRKGFATLVTAVALHPCGMRKPFTATHIQIMPDVSSPHRAFNTCKKTSAMHTLKKKSNTVLRYICMISPVWMILCLSRLPILLKIRPQISQGWIYLQKRERKAHGNRRCFSGISHCQ